MDSVRSRDYDLIDCVAHNEMDTTSVGGGGERGYLGHGTKLDNVFFYMLTWLK